MIRGIGKATLFGAPKSMTFCAKLKASPFVYNEKDVLEFDAEKVVQVLNLKVKLGLSQNNEVPPLTLGTR